MSKYRIRIEEVCTDCKGTGKGFVLPIQKEPETVTCSGCDGEGYQEILVSLADFKDLLKE